MSKFYNETRLWSVTSNSGDMISFVGTPLVKNHVNSCHGNHAFFHSKIEFIFAGKNSLHLNLCILVKQSSNNIY